jgi:hypothetical protein
VYPRWLSLDGLRLYYQHRDKWKDKPRISCAIRKSGSPTARWEPVSDEGTYLPYRDEDVVDVSLTADECEMFFISERLGGKGGADIWRTRRSSRDTAWEEPQPVAELNTPGWEDNPLISADGLTIFFSRFKVGDIAWAKRTNREDRFGPVQSLGPPVSAHDEQWEGAFQVSQDWPKPGSLAYFVRGVNISKSDVFQATWRPTSPAGASFNKVVTR